MAERLPYLGTNCAERRCSTFAGSELVRRSSNDCGVSDVATGNRHVCHGARYMPLLMTGSKVAGLPSTVLEIVKPVLHWSDQ